MMAPLLIDSRGLLKLGFLSTLTAVLIFGGGFFAGFQRAETIQQTTNYTQTLTLPQVEIQTEDSLAGSPPKITKAGENIDVDQPEVMFLAKKSVENITKVSKVISSKSDLPAKKNPESLKANFSVKIVDDSPERKVITALLTADSSFEKVPLVTIFTSVDLSKIKYSVQVGVYGQLINAENMVKLLQAQQFDAYVTDYTNKKNEIRYNVRFGYFADKKSAIRRLNKFKKDQVGDGYLVKFSADNIVNLADTRAVTQPADAREDDTSDSSNPLDELPASNMPDNISHSGMFYSNTLLSSASKIN